MIYTLLHDDTMNEKSDKNCVKNHKSNSIFTYKLLNDINTFFGLHLNTYNFKKTSMKILFHQYSKYSSQQEIN